MVDLGADSYGVRQLGLKLGVSASTAHRLLTELEKLGMVGRAPDGAYRLGLEFHRLAWASTARFPLREAAQDILRELADHSGESAFLALYDDLQHRMMFVTCVESANPLRYVMELNKWLPLHAGASGLAILAFLPPEARQVVIHTGELAAITDQTITGSEVLEQELGEIRERGYAVSHGQRIVGAVAIAAPVFGPSGAVVGDIGITMPENRFRPGSQTQLAEFVTVAAATVTRRVGGRPATV